MCFGILQGYTEYRKKLPPVILLKKNKKELITLSPPFWLVRRIGLKTSNKKRGGLAYGRKKSVSVKKNDSNSLLGKRFFVAVPDRVLDLGGNGSYLVQFQNLEGVFESWLSFAFFLYTLGLFGRVANRKNFIVTRRAVERRYLGAITSFVLYGVAVNDPRGAVYGLLLVILAACESAIGLGIILVLHRFGGTINFQDYEELGG